MSRTDTRPVDNQTSLQEQRPPRLGWLPFILHPSRPSWVFILLFYLLITIAFTWPIALHFRENAIGKEGGDVWQMVWNLWWVRYALEHGQNPLFTDLLFYPTGADLHLHALNLWNGLVSLPVQYLVGGAANGAVAGYNFIVWLSLTLGAFGTYLLIRWLLPDNLMAQAAAVVAGLGYGFSTYQFDHLLGHLNLISSEFIPFYILYFLKTFAEPQGWRRNAALSVTFLVFNLLLDIQYVLFLAVFSIVYALYQSVIYLWRRQFRALLPLYGKGLVIGLAFLVITLPFTLPTLNVVLTNPNATPDPKEIYYYSADLLTYIYPSAFHPLWGTTMQDVIRPWQAGLIEKVLFPTYTILVLALIGVVINLRFTIYDLRLRKKPSAVSPQPSAEPPRTLDSSFILHPSSFFLVVVFVFLLISFGPQLHFNGQTFGPQLPGGLIYSIPILNVSRVPARFGLIAILGLTVLAAVGLMYVGQWLQKRAGRKVALGLVGVVAAGLLFELLPAPYFNTPYTVAEFYQQIANDPANYSVLDLPIKQYETTYEKMQMTHHKPLAGGYISRNPAYPPYEGVPIFNEFKALLTAPKPDVVPSQPLSVATLRQYKVKYVVVHQKLMSEGENDKIQSLAYKLLGPPKAEYPNDKITVFEVPPGEDGNLFYAYANTATWWPQEINGDKASRWAKNKQGKLEFWASSPRVLELEFPLYSFKQPHNVEILFNGQTLDRKTIGVDQQLIRLKLDLKSGQNTLTFKIDGPTARPSDFDPQNKDERELTVGIGQARFL